MNEKRFRVAYENYGAWDKVLCKKLSYEELIDLLNEQQAIIHRDEISIKTMMSNMKKLEEENEQLRKELNDLKPVMFQGIRGTIILYSKGNNNE